MENGPHPPAGETGAKYIIREDGHRLDLRFLKRDADRCVRVPAPSASPFASHHVRCSPSVCSGKRLVRCFSRRDCQASIAAAIARNRHSEGSSAMCPSWCNGRVAPGGQAPGHRVRGGAPPAERRRGAVQPAALPAQDVHDGAAPPPPPPLRLSPAADHITDPACCLRRKAPDSVLRKQ